MKRFLYLSLTLLVLTSISACKKNEDPSPAPLVNYQDAFSGKIDGSAVTVNAVTYATAGMNGYLQLMFFTKSDNTEWIYLHVPLTIVPGTYDLTDDTAGPEYVTYHISGGDFISTSGTLQITSHDKTNHVIQGTFNASMIPQPTSSMSGTYDFTNMSFVINYTL